MVLTDANKNLLTVRRQEHKDGYWWSGFVLINDFTLLSQRD